MAPDSEEPGGGAGPRAAEEHGGGAGPRAAEEHGGGAGPRAAEEQGSRTNPLTGLVQGTLWAGAAVAGLLGQLVSGDGWGTLPIWLSVVAAVGGGLVIGIGFGFLTWYFTRYVIDGTELRVNRGVLQKSSRRIPYERIQSVDVAEPFLARVLGLAELRIEMAGGKNARTSLRFVTLEDARRLRGILLARAQGRDVADDHHDHEQLDVIAHVPPGRVVIGTLLSLDFLAAVLGAVGAAVAAVWFGQVLAFLGGLVPLTTWIVQIVGRRVLQQWDFTLYRSATGFRIERGLLSRSSQSIPFARVQGVAIEEPYVWRRFGWQRLEVDVAGQSASDRDDSSDISSTLLPIADPALAAAVLQELVPGARPDADEPVRPPRRSWPFAPIGWRYRWVVADDVAFVARSGWLQRTTDVVPHARTQSVELRQGPVQRRLGVATLEVHTPKGPVDADGRHLDADRARQLVFAQLDLARRARLPH